MTVNTAAGHRGPALVGHGVLKANGGERGEREQEGRKLKVELEERGSFFKMEHGIRKKKWLVIVRDSFLA